MSLLIKALQKAEQSKSEATENSLAASALSPKPDLELAPHHVPVEPSLHEESGFDSPVVRKAAHSQRQAAAVFQAGQGGVAGVSRTTWLAGGGALLLLLLCGGLYFYLKSLEQPEPVMVRPHASLPAPVTLVPASTETPDEVDGGEEVVKEKPTLRADAHLMGNDTPPVAAPSQGKAQAKPDEQVTSAEEKMKVRSAELASPKVTRNHAPVASVNEGVLSGYQAYEAGDDAAATRYYRQATQQEPRNVDAWLGLAAVAHRQGKLDEAAAYYGRVLELDPRNPTAQAGVAAVGVQADPSATESRLKNLLAQQPEAANLYAALGNFYAEQGQWPSAQQAYFQAFHFDPKNAEYAFNLAVSLDQMGKGDLALTHYQRALELLPREGGGVDRAQLESRIAQLRQAANK
jgi:Flp pilus assembly protein TadD